MTMSVSICISNVARPWKYNNNSARSRSSPCRSLTAAHLALWICLNLWSGKARGGGQQTADKALPVAGQLVLVAGFAPQCFFCSCYDFVVSTINTASVSVAQWHVNVTRGTSKWIRVKNDLKPGPDFICGNLSSRGRLSFCCRKGEPN